MMKLWSAVRDMFGLRSMQSSHVLCEQIAQSLKLQPVSNASQLAGAFGFLMYFWDSLSRPLLLVWVGSVCLSLWGWIEFYRRFRRDARREVNVRKWLRIWSALAFLSALPWGFSGLVFSIATQPMDQLFIVAVTVAVVFASWPVYSGWLPSLTSFTLIPIVPVLVAVATQYQVSGFATAFTLILITSFVLYSGRRLNEVVVQAVSRAEDNAKLVARLRAEKLAAQNARRATEEASARRARFFAGANHDLRQPLQAMGIYLQLLEMQSPKETLPVVRQMSDCAKNISTLVEQILEISRIETGHVKVNLQRVTVTELFSALSTEFTPIAAEKGFIFEIRPLVAGLMTDREKVLRILRNFLTNAIRYSTRPGSRIILAARRKSGGRISLCVYDQGPGISEQDRDKIFQAFYRGKTAQAGEQSGYGLGLSIVTGLAQRLNIPVSMSSRVGKGSVFRIEFDELPATEEEKVAASRLQDERFRFNGTICFLEDNKDVRDALTTMLCMTGAEVIDAEVPSRTFVKEMVDRLGQGRLQMIVSDYNLGDNEPTGLETIFEIRSRAGVFVPAVLITAVASDQIEAEYRQLRQRSEFSREPMPVILQKPTTMQSLERALAAAQSNRNGE